MPCVMARTLHAGLYVPTSDIDLVVEHSNHGNINRALHALANGISRKGIAKSVQVRQFQTNRLAQRKRQLPASSHVSPLLNSVVWCSHLVVSRCRGSLVHRHNLQTTLLFLLTVQTHVCFLSQADDKLGRLIYRFVGY